MSLYRRFLTIFLALLTAALCVFPAAAVSPVENCGTATILFTHDLHSRFLPQAAEDGSESGGYARLKTAINREKEKNPDALLLDGGDFSIGSLIQTLYTTQAAELRTMGAMGYDATVIGNHEFDHESVGFARMLNAAKDSQQMAFRVLTSSLLNDPLAEEYRKTYGPMTITLPAVLEANYTVSADNPDKAFIEKAMEDYGVEETLLIQRGGITYGIFGLMGMDADDCAPTSGFELEDAAAAAKRCVEKLKGEGAEFIVCLSHAGTGESLEVSEDEVLAKTVDGIDVIVSGHTHTTLAEPIVVKDTYIVSAGPYCENLGSITFAKQPDGSFLFMNYELIPIDETLPEDAEIAAMVEQWKAMVGEEYLNRYGWTYDQVLTTSDFDLKTPVSGVQQGNNLGELVADSFLWAADHLEAEAPDVRTVAVTADGVLRAPLLKGEITVFEAFDVLSMGVGSDGTSGFPLVGVYLTGKELKAAAEVDASVTPIMPAAQLYMSNMAYAFNTNRMFFNRVFESEVHGAPIQDEQLYRVITGMYSAQMLSTVKEKSMGLLSLEPKMADGTPVTDFNDCILRDKDGNEIKEWYALAAFLENRLGEDGIPADRYGNSSGSGVRKYVFHDWSLKQLVVGLNWISFAVLGLVLLAILLVVLVIRFVVRRKTGRNNK